MTNYLKVDHENSRLIMDKTFAKNAAIVGSPEYNLLQSSRRDYPHYEVVRRTIKKNTSMEHYKGLTYEYMETYIRNHTPMREVDQVLDEFFHKIEITKCHSTAYRYPTIKKWFLEQYPEVADFLKEETAKITTLSA